MPPTCECGKPAHPAYGGRCEDCWVDGQPARLDVSCAGEKLFPMSNQFRRAAKRAERNIDQRDE